MTSAVAEGDLQFSFSDSVVALKFDDPATHGMSHDMKAVDLLVSLKDQTWVIEIKDPQNPQIPPQHAEARRIEFLEKMNSGDLCDELHGKLRDTLVYLALSLRTPQDRIVFHVVLGLGDISAALVGSFKDRLRKSCYLPGPFGREWASRFDVLVHTVELWNRSFPQHPLTRLSES